MDTIMHRALATRPSEYETFASKFEVVATREVSSDFQRSWIVPIVLIAVIAFVILHGVRRGEFDYNVDEAQHAVTGQFMADAMRDLPLRHPVQYAYNYYAQYPAVSIVHWPPLFYVFEGISFLIAGSSVVSARLTVLLFAAVLLYNWFRLVERWQGPFTAAVSTAILGLLPSMLLFEKTVMLEIPSLTLAVLSIRYWIEYLDLGQKRSLYAFGLWMSAALLCKQTNVFVLLFCLLTLTATGAWERIWNKDVLIVAGIGCALVVPSYTVMLISQGHAVAHDLGSHQVSGLQRFTLYLRVLPHVFTRTMLAISVLGMISAYRWNTGRQIILMLSWIVAGYATFTFFGQKEARFAIYWFPPLAYFAAGLLTQYFQIPKVRYAMRWAAVGLVCLLTVRGWSYERPYISGYKNAASSLVDGYKSGIVLFDGKVPGNFVFYMRALDSNRQFLVLRKSLYVDDIRRSETSEELVHSREDILNLMKNMGVRFVVVSDRQTEWNSQRILRECLQSSQFQLLGRFPIESNERDWVGYNLLLYENKSWSVPTSKWLTIRMLTLPHDIVVPLDRFDFVRNRVQSTGTVGR
jgi:hypothetical protein